MKYGYSRSNSERKEGGRVFLLEGRFLKPVPRVFGGGIGQEYQGGETKQASVGGYFTRGGEPSDLTGLLSCYPPGVANEPGGKKKTKGKDLAGGGKWVQWVLRRRKSKVKTVG